MHSMTILAHFSLYGDEIGSGWDSMDACELRMLEVSAFVIYIIFAGRCFLLILRNRVAVDMMMC